MGMNGDRWGRMGSEKDVWEHMGIYGARCGCMGSDKGVWGRMETGGDRKGYMGMGGDRLETGKNIASILSIG